MAKEDKIKQWEAQRQQKLKSNKKFMKKLAAHKGKRLDRFVNQVHDQVFEEVSCMDCANCCTSIPPIVSTQDASRIAKVLGMSTKDFDQQYVVIDEDGDRVMNQSPCPFLQADNACSIYEARPKACREYPHTDNNSFSKYRHYHAENTLYCPASFHILERLKLSIPT